MIDKEEREALADPSYQPINLDWKRHLLSAKQTKVASHLCSQILAEDPNSPLIPDIIGKNYNKFGLSNLVNLVWLVLEIALIYSKFGRPPFTFEW